MGTLTVTHDRSSHFRCRTLNLILHRASFMKLKHYAIRTVTSKQRSNLGSEYFTNLELIWPFCNLENYKA